MLGKSKETNRQRRIILPLLGAAALGLAWLPALAQSDYPNKPVKRIVPFAPGGTSDIMGRMVADELTKAFKQPVVVENVGGAGGVIGTERAAKVLPDGYTLVLTGVGQNAVAHGLNPRLGWAMMFINQDVALPHLKSGKLRPLAVSTKQRNPLYPDVPTVSELGYPGFEALSWSGLSAPKGTPQAIVDKLEKLLGAARQSAAVRQRMESVGFVVPTQGAKAYTQFIQGEIDGWTRVIQQAGIKPE